MQEKQLVQRCRQCGKVHVSGSWRLVAGFDPDWILVDAYCPSCFVGVLGAVIHIRLSTNRSGVKPVADRLEVCGSPQVV